MLVGLESAFVVALLATCLIALILVSVARREARAVRDRAERDAQEKRASLAERSSELEERARSLHQGEADLTRQREHLTREREHDRQRSEELTVREAAAAAAQQDIEQRTMALAQMTRSEARDLVRQDVLTSARDEASAQASRIVNATREEAETKARDILVSAMQRAVPGASSSATTTTVELPHEEMRGRVIGKEGRNIQTFQAATGVDVVLEDASRSVVLSSFDPARREIAAIALERLLADGRINPQHVEEQVALAQQQAADRDLEAGTAAVHDAGVDSPNLDETVLIALGQLRLRTSHGQNVLRHSVETAQIAAVIAAETGSDVPMARRGALLHDLGKGLSGGRSHALLGAELLERTGETAAVVNAVAAHHDEVPAQSIEAVLVQVADACSAARPGARPTEAAHVAARFQQVESVVGALPGVERVLVMSAGRELRVAVAPDQIADSALTTLADDVVRTVEDTVDIPGGVRVTVIRESRAVAQSRASQVDR